MVRDREKKIRVRNAWKEKKRKLGWRTHNIGEAHSALLMTRVTWEKGVGNSPARSSLERFRLGTSRRAREISEFQFEEKLVIISFSYPKRVREKSQLS